MRATNLLWAAARHTLITPSPLIQARGPTVASASLPTGIEDDFVVLPDFFSPNESRMLLQLALWKLDRADSQRRRKRRKASSSTSSEQATAQTSSAPLQDMFIGPYGFEEGHFDSVIHNYRESLITSLPPDADTRLASVLARMYALVPGLNVPEETVAAAKDFPPAGSSTHALHLAPEGAILPHVDNLDASGQIIVGASLGATRILRLEREGDPNRQGWDVLLPSGSVYMQKGSVRYSWNGVPLSPGHRVSFMVRDAPLKSAE